MDEFSGTQRPSSALGWGALLGGNVGEYRLIVLYGWKRLIEVVKKPLPFLILRRLTKSNPVIFKRSPLDQQNILIRGLIAALKLMRDIAWH